MNVLFRTTTNIINKRYYSSTAQIPKNDSNTIWNHYHPWMLYLFTTSMTFGILTISNNDPNDDTNQETRTTSTEMSTMLNSKLSSSVLSSSLKKKSMNSVLLPPQPLTKSSSLPPSSSSTTMCDGRRASGDIVLLEPHKEPKTGILFPHLCNGMTFVGCGVRVKYGFVKVYAVATYVDPIAMSGSTSSTSTILTALLNPTVPRTIRIVMNRNLSIDKYTAAIIEALKPRMNGQDLDTLDEFIKLNPKVDLIEGAVMEMTVRGSTMLYKNSLGGVGQIESEAFCKALCDVYYGEDCVSVGHRDDVVNGISKLR